jgi:hypothetical protein
MAAEMITTLPVKTKPGETVKIVTDQLPASLTQQGNLKVALMEGQVNVTATESFADANGTPQKALVDSDRHVQVDVLTMPSVSVTLAEKGFSNASDTPTRALVDADRHVQTDVLSLPVTKGDWLSVLPNPSNLDVALSTRASESTLSGIKAQTDKLTFDSSNRLKVLLESLPNPSNLDVALSTRASEATLSAIKNALGSVGTDKMRVSIVDALPAGSNTIGNVYAIKSGTWNIDNLLNPHPVKFTPEEKMQDANQFTGTYAPTAAGGTTIISAVTGKVIRVYDFYLWNSGSADVGVRLYFGTSGKNLFKGKLSAKTGVVKSFVRPWESNAGDSLVLYLDAAGTVDYGVGAVQA